MDQQAIRDELDKRKETLEKMFAKFNQLKDEGKLSEAWQQLVNTLQYSNESLKYSAGLLRLGQIRMTPEQMKETNETMSRLSGRISKLGGDIKREFVDSLELDVTNLGVRPVKRPPTVKKMIVIPRKQSIH